MSEARFALRICPEALPVAAIEKRDARGDDWIAYIPIRKHVLPSTLHLDDVFAVSDSEKASLFNTYFHSVFTRSSFQLPPFSEFEMPSSSLSDICISELDVFRVLRSLDVTKAKGCDGISPKLLKTCALSLYQPLHHLFSLSLSQKYLPLEWRTHLIKPIIKSGDKSSITD